MRRALVGDVQELNAGFVREQFRQQMHLASDAERGVGELARLRFGQRYQFGDIVRRDRWVPHQHHAEIANQRYRREIAKYVIRQLRIEMGIDRETDVDTKQ